MTTATLDRVVTRQSGRKAARTDYVYTLASTDGWNHERKAYRTLRSAKRAASVGLSRPTVTKGWKPGTWTVASSCAPCSTIITRVALVN